MNDLLMYIDQIDQSVSNAEINVLESLIRSYDKSIMILENSDDTVDVTSFDIFQEGEKWNKFKEDTKAPVLGNKGEGIAKRLLMIIPRLIQKLVALIRKISSKIRNKKLLRKIDYIEEKGKRIKIKYNGKLTKETCAAVMRRIKDQDFRNMAVKKGKLNVVSEASGINIHKIDPIREIRKASPGIEQLGDNSAVVRSSEKIKRIFETYDNNHLLEFAYSIINIGKIRSHFDYKMYHDYLMEYDESLRMFTRGHRMNDDNLEGLTNVLKGVTHDNGLDTGRKGEEGHFKSETKFNQLMTIEQYKEIMNDIERLTRSINQSDWYTELISINEKDLSHTSNKFVEELKDMIEYITKRNSEFWNEIQVMEDYVAFTDFFEDELLDIMADVSKK